ncbi:MAG: hypothetical protein M1830_000051 [Pleopsidium flavum]|nr:MAG: hypothetical protein M1830_000051 [Pleopsidium flavum]
MSNRQASVVKLERPSLTTSQPTDSHSYAARVVHSEQARMSPRELKFFRSIQEPVEETPLERFLTVNGSEEPNNVFARREMKAIEIRRQAAERLRKELLASKENRHKTE